MRKLLAVLALLAPLSARAAPPGPPAYVAPSATVDKRPPAASDTASWPVGSLWRQSTGTLYQATVSGRWAQLPAQRLPLDAVTGANAAYATRRLSLSYTGPLFQVACGTSGTTNINSLGDGGPDLYTLNTVCGGALPKVTLWYDQTGNGFNCTPAAAANDPEIPTYPFAGVNAPPMLFDWIAPVAGSAAPPVAEYCTMSNSAVESGGVVSVALVADAYSDSISTPYAQIGLPYTVASLSIASQLAGNAPLTVFGGSTTSTGRRSPSHPSVMIVADSASSRTTFVDNTTVTSSLGTLGTLTGGWLGAFGSGAAGSSPNYTGGARMWAAIVYPVALTTAQTGALNVSLSATFGLTPQARDNVVCDGDSRWQGYGATQTRNVCTRAAPLFNRPVRLTIPAIQGHSIEQQAALYATNVAPLFDSTALNNVLDFEAGVNDFIVPPQFTGSISGTVLTVTALTSGYFAPGQVLSSTGATAIAAGTTITGQASGTTGGVGTYNLSVSQTVASEAMTASQTATAAYSALSAYVATAHGTGWRIGCHTLLPSGQLGVLGSTAAWTAYNAAVLANTAGCDWIVDEQSDPTIGPISAASNTTYYTDSTHLTDAGQDIEAQLEAAAINGALR